MASLPTEGDMDINAGHFGAKLHKLMQRVWVLLLFLFSVEASGQIDAEVFVDGSVQKVQFKDTVQLNKYILRKQIEWIDQGYLFSGIDSVSGNKIYLYKGKRYQSEILGKKKIIAEAKSQLTYLINHGYPFASISFDSLLIKEDVFSGKLKVDKGPEIRLDSINLLNDVKTDYSYLSNLLELEPGELFSEKDYQLIDKRVKRSSFLRLEKEKDIAFQNNKAEIFLDLAKSSTNQFEGIIGLQQNRTGGSTAVGSLRLDADNLFRSGHQFNFLWERFSEESQNLNIHYRHSFLFDSPISPSFKFGLLKQDTTFLTRTSDIGINLFIFNDIRFVASFESINASLISNDIEVVQGRALADYQRRFYRLELVRGYLNALATLSEGMTWRVSFGLGDKEIERNLSLPETYYDSINLKTEFLELSGMMAYQVAIAKRQLFFHQLNFGLLNNSELLSNELYRIGGFNTLRGFNEKEFFAERYFSSRLELRSFFERGSFFYLFYDQLFFDQNSKKSTPFGIGIGFALETQSGQFNFAIATGKSNQQSISFEELRIHFGYTARF